ncbi:hypothetical protein C3941_15630 [Kaistia algarum]|nr:hypothetical protein C3941_15630 [Kaistia algarum]
MDSKPFLWGDAPMGAGRAAVDPTRFVDLNGERRQVFVPGRGRDDKAAMRGGHKADDERG